MEDHVVNKPTLIITVPSLYITDDDRSMKLLDIGKEIILKNGD